MARFATTKVPVSVPTTVNIAGGQAFKMTPKLEFASALLTCFTTDTFYKSGEQDVSRIAELTRTVDPLFAAKAAVYTRKKGGLRSVTHIVAGELAQRVDVKGQPWLRKFFSSVVVRPDDITETLSYMKAHGNPKLRSLSNALKRGFGSALSKFDAYQLGKYMGSGKDLNLIDAVNLLHPKSSEALKALMEGTLQAPNTWEVKLTQVGQKASQEKLSDAEKTTLKGTAWTELLTTKKLGYLACLRNLRNISTQAPDALPLALDFIQDPTQVAKSMVLPFQIFTATEILQNSGNATKKALEKAMELSLSNVPKFDGKTLIAVDVSGSMQGRTIRIAALMASVLFKSQDDADVLLFDTSVQNLNLNPCDSLTTICQTIEKRATGGGTNFNLIFSGAKQAYDRIIILSDMQAWVKGMWNSNMPTEAFKAYKKTFSADPRIFSFDLCSQDGTLQFPESKVFALAGFSDAILGVMKNLERDPAALVHEIESIELE